MKIIKQKQISPRKMWPNEAVDFTPWLAENIEELAEKIGMELEVVGQEVSVTGKNKSRPSWKEYHVCVGSEC